MKTSVVRRYTFEAAHHLTWHPGKCRRPHGHSYRLEVTVSGQLDARGVVLDFAEVDEVLNPILMDIDHCDLNEVIENPTAERIAQYIALRLDRTALRWTTVRLWETERGSVLVER